MQEPSKAFAGLDETQVHPFYIGCTLGGNRETMLNLWILCSSLPSRLRAWPPSAHTGGDALQKASRSARCHLPSLHPIPADVHRKPCDACAPHAGKPLHQLVAEAGEKTRALKANRPTARELGCNEVPRQVRCEKGSLCLPGCCTQPKGFQRCGFAEVDLCGQRV